jgi:hypothetical protein
MTLPLRHGGLGLSCTSPAEGSAAYLAADLAAAATTHQAMLNGPEAFRPFDGPSGAQLRTQWASLHDRAGTLWPPEYREVSPDSLGTLAAALREFSRLTAQSRADALLESFDPNTTEGRSGRARLLSCACRPALAWLDTVPLTKSLELKRGEVRTGLRHRLGISLAPTPPPCSATAAGPFALPMLSMGCGARPLLHTPR